MGGAPTEREEQKRAAPTTLGWVTLRHLGDGCPSRDAQHRVRHLGLPVRREATAGAQTWGSAASRYLLKLTGGRALKQTRGPGVGNLVGERVLKGGQRMKIL